MAESSILDSIADTVRENILTFVWKCNFWLRIFSQVKVVHWKVSYKIWVNSKDVMWNISIHWIFKGTIWVSTHLFNKNRFRVFNILERSILLEFYWRLLEMVPQIWRLILNHIGRQTSLFKYRNWLNLWSF